VTDPMTVAIATAMAGKAVEVAGEPVRAAVAELTRRVRERLRGRPADQETVARASGNDQEIPVIEGVVHRLLEDDPALRTELRALWEQAQIRAKAADDGVVNVFNGQADRVVQLRDVHGDLNL
jgi:DNA topoisomerase VI subunit B